MALTVNDKDIAVAICFMKSKAPSVGLASSAHLRVVFQTKAATCLPTGFPTDLRQVYDRFPSNFRYVLCVLPKSVPACVPAGVPTGLRQVYDRFPTGSGENPKICTKNVDISFPTGFFTGLRQVHDRFPT